MWTNVLMWSLWWFSAKQLKRNWIEIKIFFAQLYKLCMVWLICTEKVMCACVVLKLFPRSFTNVSCFQVRVENSDIWAACIFLRRTEECIEHVHLGGDPRTDYSIKVNVKWHICRSVLLFWLFNTSVLHLHECKVWVFSKKN